MATSRRALRFSFHTWRENLSHRHLSSKVESWAHRYQSDVKQLQEQRDSLMRRVDVLEQKLSEITSLAEMQAVSQEIDGLPEIGQLVSEQGSLDVQLDADVIDQAINETIQ